MFKVGAINGRAVLPAFLGIFAILGCSSPSYASTIVVNDFTTPENTNLVVTAPGVGTGATDPASILFYIFGAPTTGNFNGLVANGGNLGSTDGSFTFVPTHDFTGTVTFLVEGSLTNPVSSSFTNTVTDSIVVTGPTSATPLPAALPLFATGIGGLGLLGWRRKRKARAV
jgi:hypothetical protein